MTSAVAFIRRSQGDEDDVSLQLQRSRVGALADDLADTVETIDLGVHTGFSIHMRPDSKTRIATNEQILALLKGLRAGMYDYLCAWDDTRLARDQFFWELKRAAIVGGCELAFVEEPPEDELTFRVQRAVESDVKRREIQKSKAALEQREEQGHDQGRPPFGMTYDSAGERWVPDRESENGERSDFQKALYEIKARENGLSWRDVAAETDVQRTPPGTSGTAGTVSGGNRVSMTDDEPPVSQLHDTGDPRFSLRHITDDPSERTEYMVDQDDWKVAIAEESVASQTLYLFYVRPVVEAAYPEFDSEADVISWVDETFSESDLEIVVAVMDIFDGILAEKEAQNGEFSAYKRMDLEKIPEVLNRVQWRQAVPAVGAGLLSRFILGHPMPNTNHRTAIGLLDRYLTSYDAGFAMPDTGEEGRWFDWARDYIYDSKRLLTLRNKYRLLYWADQYGETPEPRAASGAIGVDAAPSPWSENCQVPLVSPSPT